MNYAAFYNLTGEPFAIAVDDRFYFNSEQHTRALVKLKHATEERKGLALLVGDLGTGKTTLARRLLEEMDESVYEAALLAIIHPTTVTSQWLLKKVATQLGVETPSADRNDLIAQLYTRLTEIDDSNRKAVILIDEAQMLHQKEIMEELRGLLNMEPDGHKLITFVLFGSPDIDTHLASHRPFQQNVAVRCRLQPFSPETTEEYIRYRLDVAGAKKTLFSKGSYDIIHRYSGGIPRIINTICDNALLEGALLKKQSIDEDIFQNVIADLNLADTTTPTETPAVSS
jgi:type II secretory pathway predicted ATPase ExeA